MKWPNQDNIVYGIVCGGDDSDPDPTESGGFRVYLPSEYGPSVQRTHLPFSRMMTSGTEEGVTKFNPPPERGSAVLCMKTTGHSGTGHLLVLGVLPNDINNDDTLPQNISLMERFPVLKASIEHKINVLIPPNIVEKNKRGAAVRVIKEKGVKHSHKLMKGIPSTGTLYPLNGYPIPQVNNISTAIDAFTAIVTKEVFDKLPGVQIDIGSLLELLPARLQAELQKAMPAGIYNAMKAMTNLMQQMSFVETSGFLTAYRVNKKTYFVNIVNLLKDVKDINELSLAFQRMQSDASLFGIDDVIKKIKIQTPFGDVSLQIVDGLIQQLIPPEVQALIEAFLGFLTNASQFPSVLPTVNFFGESAKTFAEMLPRLTPKEFDKRKTILEVAVGSGSAERRRLNEYQRLVTSSGNVLSLPTPGTA